MTEEEIFDVLLQLPESERETYLQQACQSDTQLLGSVRLLLKFHAESRGFMRASAVENLVAPDVILDTGTAIGPYRLLEPLGQGGMGIVYRAVQSEPVNRQVAIKVIKPGLDTREIVARFRAEQRALAVMDHPFIAKVLEAGCTQTGRPYFVMELADGLSISEYSDRHHLSIEARLHLIIKVCAAVQHAHAKSIIHRDIKPSNVLIVENEGQPVPKVIDFGVAKALDRDPMEQTILTQTTQFIGTPIYMSPEQFDSSIQDIDTRADIYSLGVLTYEILTGCTPFERGRLGPLPLEEVRRIIREEEPPRPSYRVHVLGERAKQQAVLRGTDPDRLARRLKGDLDWIVMKAMEKGRERRYETANELADDLRRYLSYEPVLASPPSRWYRIKRTLWRHRVAVAFAAAILTLSVIGTLGTTAGLIATRQANKRLVVALASEAQQVKIAERERELAEREREVAKVEREVAESVVLFLNRDLLSAATPSMEPGKGHDIRMRDVLSSAGVNLDKATGPGGPLQNKPLVESHIRYAIGHTFLSLGLPSDALEHLERARQLLESADVREEVKLPTLSALSEAYNHVGKTIEGIDLAKLVVQGLEKVHGADSEKVLDGKYNLAVQLHSVGKFEECKHIFEDLCRLRSARYGPTDWMTLETELGLAGVNVQLKDFHAAEELFQKALRVGRERQDPNVIKFVLQGLAEIRFEQGDYESAYSMLEESYENAVTHYGPEHSETIEILGQMGIVAADLGNFEEANSKLRAVYEANVKASGPIGTRTVASRLNLVATLWNGNFRKEADDLILTHLAETINASGHDNTWVRRLFFQIDLMAEAYEEEGDLDRAEPFRRLSLDHDLALASASEPTISDLKKAALALAHCKHPGLRNFPKAISLLELALQQSSMNRTDQVEMLQEEMDRLRSLVESGN